MEEILRILSFNQILERFYAGTRLALLILEKMVPARIVSNLEYIFSGEIERISFRNVTSLLFWI